MARHTDDARDARVERRRAAAQRVERQRRGHIRRVRRISASRSASASSASIACVPFSSARPSLASSASGAIPRAAHRFAARKSCDPRKSPRPRRSPPAPDARAAPDRPTRPPSLATESRDAPRDSAWRTAFPPPPGRTPEKPFASALARSTSIARVSGSLERRADAARVAAHQIHLQLANFLARDAHGRHFPESSVYAVDGASESITRSITAREAFIRSRARAEISTSARSNTTL